MSTDNVSNLQLFAHSLARRLFRSNDQLVKLGAGEDDVAVLDCKGIGNLLVSSDYLNTKRFSDTYLQRDFTDLGRHCVRQNASDILGSGGIPRWFMLSAIFDRSCTAGDLEAFFSSVQAECERLGITVIGGDTKEGNSVIVHGTIFGEAASGGWTMGTCLPDSDLFVTGALSGVSAALCILEFSQSHSLREQATAALSAADLPLEVVTRLRGSMIAVSATDISDGLGYSVNQFARRSSGVRLSIELERVPLHPLTDAAANMIGVPAQAFGFAFGGDFQIVFVAPKRHRSEIERLGGIRIGEVTEGQGTVVSWHGEDLSSVPDFGHLDFEVQRPVERFVEIANSFGSLLRQKAT